MAPYHFLFIPLCLYMHFFTVNGLDLQIERIQSGELARPGQFRYMCALQIRDVTICGCGILNDLYVITAAHCVVGKNGKYRDYAYNVLAGVNDLRYRKAGVKSNVEKAFVHSGYLPDRSLDDIAILQLGKSLQVKSNPNLEALIVPLNDHKYYADYVGKQAVVAGYGWDYVKIKVDKKTGKLKEIGKLKCRAMNFINVEIISNRECREKTPNEIVADTILCAMAKPNDPTMEGGVCSGDSGSPMVVEGNVALAILSTSPFGCDESKEAAKYTKLGPYYKFIDDIRNGRINSEADVHEVKGTLHPTLRSIIQRFYPSAVFTKSDDAPIKCEPNCDCLPEFMEE